MLPTQFMDGEEEENKIKTKKSNYLKDYLCHLESKHIYFKEK